MGYVIHFDEKLKAVIGVVEGDIDVPLVNQFGLQLFTEGEKHQCTKYLADLRNTCVTDTMINIADFALHLEETGIKTEYHIAIVIQRNETEHNLFAAMTKNRGYSKIRYFRDIDAAHTWLFNLP